MNNVPTISMLDATELAHLHGDMLTIIHTNGAYAKTGTPEAFDRYQKLLAKTGMVLMSATMRKHLAVVVDDVVSRRKAAITKLFG